MTPIPPGFVRNIPTEEGQALGAELARLADGALLQLNGAVLERCATCAFRAGTMANGCAATLMNALKCAMEGEESFYCHEKNREGCVCAGYLALRFSQPVKAPWEFVKGAGRNDGHGNSLDDQSSSNLNRPTQD